MIDRSIEIERTLSPKEKLSAALGFIEDTKKKRGDSITMDDFKTITQFSTEYDEGGRSFNDKSHYYHLDESGRMKEKDFYEMIHDPVYMLLKYHGSFNAMITSPYFIHKSQNNKFFFKSSPKVPFYLVYECSPYIQDALMSKFLDNPINPMMLISYNQRVPDLISLESTDPRIERTIHMDIAYSKFKTAAPMLMCFGSP